MAPKHSIVWKFFTVLGGGKAQCSFCGGIMSYKESSTSNLMKHLKRHPLSANEMVVARNKRRERELLPKKEVTAKAAADTDDDPDVAMAKPEDADENPDATITEAIFDPLEESVDLAKSNQNNKKITKPPGRSIVWKYFTVVAAGKAKCAFCSSIMAYKESSTSNLIKHLRRHPLSANEIVVARNKRRERRQLPQAVPANAAAADTDDDETAMCGGVEDTDCMVNTEVVEAADENHPQPTAEASFDPLAEIVHWATTTPESAHLDMRVLRMLVCDLQPFSMVDDAGFGEFVKALAPHYQLPSRSTLTRCHLFNKFNSVEEGVKRMLGQLDCVALATDIWTTPKQQTYIGVTATFIGDDWTRRTAFLGHIGVAKRPTAHLIKNELLQMCDKWGLGNGKVTAILTDHASQLNADHHTEPVNVNVLLQDAIEAIGWPHLRCIVQTIDLIVQDALAVIKPLRTKVKETVQYFQRNKTAAAKLKDTQIRYGATPLILLNEVSTKWQSTFGMLDRVCAVQTALVSSMEALGEAEVRRIGDTEFELMQQTVDFLRPFVEAATELRAETNVSASKVIVLVGVLKKILNAVFISSSCEMWEMADRMLAHFQEQWPMLEEQTVLAMATYLDPRFKKQAFQDPQLFEQCHERVQSAVTQLAANQVGRSDSMAAAAAPATGLRSVLWAEFDDEWRADWSSSGRSGRSCVGTLEVQQYADELSLRRDDNALVYWKQRDKLFPRLAQLAKQYLALLATTVPMDSGAMGDRQSLLQSDHLEMVMFLHRNIDLFDA